MPKEERRKLRVTRGTTGKITSLTEASALVDWDREPVEHAMRLIEDARSRTPYRPFKSWIIDLIADEATKGMEPPRYCSDVEAADAMEEQEGELHLAVEAASGGTVRTEFTNTGFKFVPITSTEFRDPQTATRAPGDRAGQHGQATSEVEEGSWKVIRSAASADGSFIKVGTDKDEAPATIRGRICLLYTSPSPRDS